MGQGVDLTNVEDQDLASHIQVASALVNSHCNVPHDFDFRGGTITGEDHDWDLGNYMVPGPGTIPVDHPPLKTLTQFRIYVTNTQFLEIDPARIHYHEKENRLEPLFAEASIGVWAAAQVPIAGYKTPQARIDYTYGYTFSITDELMFPDGGIRWRAQNQWWDSSVTPTIKVNGAAIAPADLVIDYDEGTADIDDDVLLALDIAADEVDTVTASYTFRLPVNIMQATGMITTSLLGRRAIAEKGLQGLSGIKVEEVELRQSRDSQMALDDIPGNAQMLLSPYRRLLWGA